MPIQAEGTVLLVDHHQRAPDFYAAGSEKIRKFDESLQDPHPVHWSEDAAAGLGCEGLIAQRHLFDEIVTGYDPSEILHTDGRLNRQRSSNADRAASPVTLRAELGASLERHAPIVLRLCSSIKL